MASLPPPTAPPPAPPNDGNGEDPITTSALHVDLLRQRAEISRLEYENALLRHNELVRQRRRTGREERIAEDAAAAASGSGIAGGDAGSSGSNQRRQQQSVVGSTVMGAIRDGLHGSPASRNSAHHSHHEEEGISSSSGSDSDSSGDKEEAKTTKNGRTAANELFSSSSSDSDDDDESPQKSAASVATSADEGAEWTCHRCLNTNLATRQRCSCKAWRGGTPATKEKKESTVASASSTSQPGKKKPSSSNTSTPETNTSTGKRKRTKKIGKKRIKTPTEIKTKKAQEKTKSPANKITILSGTKRSASSRLDDSVNEGRGDQYNRLFVQQALIELLRNVRSTVDPYGYFSYPVNPENDDAPDYYDVIDRTTEAMDFNTMETLIKSGELDTVDEFEALLKRIVSCCLKYNRDPKSDVHREGKRILPLSGPLMGKARKVIANQLTKSGDVKPIKRAHTAHRSTLRQNKGIKPGIGEHPAPQLGKGWTMEGVPRKRVDSKTIDYYYYSPKEKIRLRSKKEVERFQDALKSTRGDEIQAYSMIQRR